MKRYGHRKFFGATTLNPDAWPLTISSVETTIRHDGFLMMKRVPFLIALVLFIPSASQCQSFSYTSINPVWVQAFARDVDFPDDSGNASHDGSIGPVFETVSVFSGTAEAHATAEAEPTVDSLYFRLDLSGEQGSLNGGVVNSISPHPTQGINRIVFDLDQAAFLELTVLIDETVSGLGDPANFDSHVSVGCPTSGTINYEADASVDTVEILELDAGTYCLDVAQNFGQSGNGPFTYSGVVEVHLPEPSQALGLVSGGFVLVFAAGARARRS